MGMEQEGQISEQGLRYLHFWRTGEVDGSVAALIAWARAQRILPLIGWRAAQQGWTLPASLAQAVQQARYREAAWQMIASRQLRELGDLAARLQISVVVVKGPVVAGTYPAPALRPYSDLDVLVPETSAAALMAALETQGYRPEVSGDRSTHFPPLSPPFSGLRIEVHAALDHRGQYFSYARWVPDLIPWDSFPGLSLPSTVQHFLYLVYHALVRHELQIGVLALADFRFWTAAWTSGDWAMLAEAAAALGLQRMVKLALGLMAWFWEEPLPHDVAQRFPPPPEELLVKSAELLLTGGAGLVPHLWRDLPEPTLRGWLAYVHLVVLGDPQTRRALPLGRKISFYLLRPLRLLSNYAPMAWQLVRGDSQSRASWQAQRELLTWLRSED